MPWFSVWDGLKNKTCRYLLQRYLGQFIQEKLNLQQLNVELYNGKATVKNVSLNVESLNELCETQGWGVEVNGGHIGLVTVTVPWNALMTNDSSIEVTDLYISLRPVQRQNDGSSMLESMWSSVSSSMQLAQECIEKQVADEDDLQFNAQSNSIEGLEKFAQTIDSVLNRIKAKCINTVIRLEYLPPKSSQGIAIIIKIKNLNYQNEAGNGNNTASSKSNSPKKYNNPSNTVKEKLNASENRKSLNFLSTFATHNITIEGLTFHTEEFKLSTPEIKQEKTPSNTANANSVISEQSYSESYKRCPPDESITVSPSLSSSSYSQSRTPITDNEIKPAIEIYSSKCIQVVRIDSTLKILIKMKQAEEVTGPKVSFDVEFGAIFIFVTPRQLHLISSFCNTFFCRKLPPIEQSKQQIMSNDLQHTNNPIRSCSSNMTGILGDQGNWGDTLEEINIRKAAMVPPSMIGVGFGCCESVSSSMSSSGTTTCSSKFQRKAGNLETCGDISNFNIRVLSVNAVILHEDILVESKINSSVGKNGTDINSPLTEESEANLVEISSFYFSCIDEQSDGGFHEFLCKKNHIKLFMGSILSDGIQQRNNSAILMKFFISITKLDLNEVLGNISKPLIEFDRKELCVEGLHKRPEITILLKTTTPSNPFSLGKNSIPLHTECNITLEKCNIELDISIYDRLSALLCQSPFTDVSCETADNASASQQSGIGDTLKNETSRNFDAITETKISSSILKLKLRFPIVDIRPIQDPNRIPWSKQNIRPDFLLINFYQFRFKLSSSLFETLANQIDVFYCESPTIPKVHLLQTNLVNNNGPLEPNVDYPKITIEIPSEKQLNSLKFYTNDSDSSETSGESCEMYARRNRPNLPFSSKRVCRQTDTSHSKRDSIDESEIVLLPGESIEMRQFCDRTMQTSKMQIKISLPAAVIQVNSKQLYEIIYNRLNNDLLMWEPSSPSFSNVRKPPPAPTIEETLFNIGMMDSVYMPSKAPTDPYGEGHEDANTDDYAKNNIFKANIPCNRLFNSSDGYGSRGRVEGSGICTLSDNESESIYYSMYEKKRSKRSHYSSSSSVAHSSSVCSFELFIDKGRLTLYSPVRDSENRVLPGQLGEFVIKIDSLKIFSVSGFNTNKNLAYLCIQSKFVEVYHCGLIPLRDSALSLPAFNCSLPVHMQATFYPTPIDDMKKGNSKGCVKREMLSMAIEIKKIPEQQIKRLKITTCIQKATLRHRTALSQHTWLNQVIDFLDILDFPIEGYKPFGIVTEMQLHLWDCTIDYRPKNFTHRGIIEIGSFMVSSNIISSVSGCILRFIAEDCVLSLAPYNANSMANCESQITAMPSSNLVPVLDIGLLDISMRLSDKATDRCPKLDLRTSIQDVHVRTCSDSGRALAQLIAYIAGDGDLYNQNEDNETILSSMNSFVCSETDFLQVNDRKCSVPEISAKQQERVNLLMAEALQETVTSSPDLLNYADGSDEYRCDRGVEVFFFPDESHQLNTQPTHPLAEDALKTTSGDRLSSAESSAYLSGKFLPSPALPSGSSIKNDEWGFKSRCGSESSNELQDLLNFETSVMATSFSNDVEVAEALPQIKEELGDISCTEENVAQSRRSSFGLDDDFCIIADEEKTYMSQCGIKHVKISDDPLRIVDNHFRLPTGKPDLLKSPENFPMAVMRYTLCEMTLTWHLYGGNDFPLQTNGAEKNHNNKEKENISCPSTRKFHMSEAYKHGVSYSKRTQSIQYGKKPKEKLSWKTIGGSNRNHEVLVEIQMNKVRFSHETYPRHTTQAFRQVLVVSELEIRDRLQSSDINKFLYHPSTKHLPNKSTQHMIVLKALHVRPNPLTDPSQECSLRISILPLRLNIDQDTLLFLSQFFSELSEAISSDESVGDVKGNGNDSADKRPPVMMVEDIPEAVQDIHSRQMVSKNLYYLMEGDKSYNQDRTTHNSTQVSYDVSSECDAPIYFREVIFSPEVLIRLDYHGHRIEMSRGPVAGLLMGLGQLQCSEIRLRKIVYKHGILGVDKLIIYLCKEWLKDIKRNQLPAILSGVGPTYAFIQLFQGIYDLFWLPIEQYQKDGRFIRGLQLGAQSFTARTALAALEITSRIIQLLQFTAETAFDMVSPGPSVRRCRLNQKGKRKRPHRPKDIREGVANAYNIVKEGINDSASNLIETAFAEHDQKGYTGAVGAVMRQIPQLVVRPAVLATQATTNILGGVKSSLVPDAKFETREKWKEDSD